MGRIFEGMRLNLNVLALITASIIVNAGATDHSQRAEDQLQRLVGTSAERLAIAEQVALAKWDSGAPVEDVARQAQVISDAVKLGDARGLKSDEVALFFRAQIEANKLVQYSLLADWRRIGKAPEHQPVSLASLRPKLDQLELEMIEELSGAATIRVNPSCSSSIARAVGKYVSAHRNQIGSLKAVALDRALAATCSA
jgi:chorismate mutase